MKRDSMVTDNLCDVVGYSFPKIISLEGNIGVGKTTLIKNMQDFYTKIKWSLQQLNQEGSCVFIIPDRYPIKIYLDNFPRIKFCEEIFPEDLLKDFYEGKLKNFYFQEECIKRKQIYEKNIIYSGEYDIIVFDRISESCIYFINALFEINLLSYEEQQKLIAMIKENILSVNQFWYLNPKVKDPIDFYLKNIKKRDRLGEEIITREYLELLQKHITHYLDLKENNMDPKLVEPYVLGFNNMNDNLAQKLVYDLIKNWQTENNI